MRTAVQPMAGSSIEAPLPSFGTPHEDRDRRGPGECLQRVALAVVAVLMLWPAPLAGQVSPSEPLKFEALPILIERVRHQLARQPPSEAGGLRLIFHVEVVGKAPALDLFKDFDTTAGPVPYGAPTHAEILQLVTPQGFRAPAADLSSVLVWVAKRLAGKKGGS